MRGAVPSYIFMVCWLIKHKDILTLTVFTSTIRWILPSDNESRPQPHALFSNSILILSLNFHLVLHVSNDIFLSGEMIKISYFVHVLRVSFAFDFIISTGQVPVVKNEWSRPTGIWMAHLGYRLHIWRNWFRFSAAGVREPKIRYGA